jgi:hypothetical protein
MEESSIAPALLPDPSHHRQAAALWRRWRERRQQSPRKAVAPPSAAEMPARVWRHYRHFAWVASEQRLIVLLLGFLAASDGIVWSQALALRRKPPVVVRAAPSLKEEEEAFFRVPEISYDQLSFFLNGCLPLLYAEGSEGHPLLPLAEGLVAPEIYSEAEHRLDGAARAVRSNRMTQSLTLTGLDNVVSDGASGRAAADASGYLTVTLHGSLARFFPWRAHVLLEANPPSRLNPYPFYLLRLQPETHD